MIRLTSSGSFDTSFASPTSGSQVQAISVQSSGKILLGGTFTVYNLTGSLQQYLIQLNSDGTESLD
jgi:hypothetical protein